MRKNFEDGVCPFCTIDTSINAILWENEHAMAWVVPDAFRRSSLRVQALVVPKRHTRFVKDLIPEEVLSIHRGIQFITAECQYRGGLLHVREGDMRLNAGTVAHIHYNIFEPTGTEEVRVPVFKDDNDRIRNRERTTNFAVRYESGQEP